MVRYKCIVTKRERSGVIPSVNTATVRSDAPPQDDAFHIEAVFREHYPRVAGIIARVVHDHASEEQERVRLVLSLLESCQAELLVLRSHGFRYEEIGSILDLNPASVGTLLARAQQAFRKEYTRRYGHE